MPEGCTDEHARFCLNCSQARAYNAIHCQDCGEGRPSAATVDASALNWVRDDLGWRSEGLADADE